MSDTPGKNLRPSDNRRGGGSRNRRHQRHSGGHRQQRREEMWENHGEEMRLPHRQRRGDEGKRGEREGKKPAAAPGLGQKLLRIFTFGLLGGKSSQKPKPAPKQNTRPQDKSGNTPRQQDRPPRREPRKPAPPAPVDVDSITTERLHIGNLSYDTSESDLQSLFGGIGKVQTVEVIYNSATHRSKGFGFVQFMNVADARRAVAELHGKPFMGRVLSLGPARERRTGD